MYIKITVEDLEIAEEFFENENHFDEFVVNVFRYYRGKNVKFKTKIVEKYFKTYKKTMDKLINLRNNGKKGGLQRVENETNNKNLLASKSSSQEQATAKPNIIINKDNIIENKIKEININVNEIYKNFSHLSMTVLEFEKLNIIYSKRQIDEVLIDIENYRKNTNYKSLYLTASKWLKKEFPNQIESQIGETEVQRLQRLEKEFSNKSIKQF